MSLFLLRTSRDWIWIEFITSLATHPSLFLSMLLNSFSMCSRSPLNSSNVTFWSRFQPFVLKKSSTSALGSNYFIIMWAIIIFWTFLVFAKKLFTNSIFTEMISLQNEKCSKDNDSTHSICTEMCHRGTRDNKWNNDFKILWIFQMPFSVWSGIGYILATSSTYSVVGTPEELRTLYHSSFVRLPFLSLSDFLKYLFTCIDKKYLDNMCIFKR